MNEMTTPVGGGAVAPFRAKTPLPVAGVPTAVEAGTPTKPGGRVKRNDRMPAPEPTKAGTNVKHPAVREAVNRIGQWLETIDDGRAMLTDEEAARAAVHLEVIEGALASIVFMAAPPKKGPRGPQGPNGGRAA